jgi:hypothetical protein
VNSWLWPKPPVRRSAAVRQLSEEDPAFGCHGLNRRPWHEPEVRKSASDFRLSRYSRLLCEFAVAGGLMSYGTSPTDVTSSISQTDL